MQAVILAAGASSRFVPFTEDGHKALFEVMGKAFIDYTFESLERAGIDEKILVVSPNSELAKLKDKARIVVQQEPKGMGNALKQCDGLEDQFVLISPYYFNAEDFIAPMRKKSEETGARLVLATQETSTPWKYGMLELEKDKATKIIEKPTKGKEPSKMKAQSIYLLPKEIIGYLSKIKEHQYSFEDALQLYMKEKDVRAVNTGIGTASIKYPWDVFDAMEKIMDRFLDVEIHDSAQIDESVTIKGKVFIGQNTRIFNNAVINGPCYIGPGCVIGNNSLVRESACLEEGASIGMNTEVKHSYIGKNSSIHSGFVGDSIIGKDCKIGAGFITANRRTDRQNITPDVNGMKRESGKSFLGSIIGNRTRLGIRVSTMPGVIAGNDCLIGPGTTLFKNVKSKTKYSTRFQNQEVD